MKKTPVGQRRGHRRKALIILDMISDYRFEDGSAVLRSARGVAGKIAALKVKANAAGAPVIYVNDAAGKWESDQTAYLRRCLSADARGADVVARLKPQSSDHFIFKPKHSGFYATPLTELLHSLKVSEVVLTGLTSHQCVLFTAMDAYVRDFQVTVPTDAIAAPDAKQNRHALFVLRESLRARTPRSASVRFK